MQGFLFSLAAIASAATGALANDLKIDVLLPVECDRHSQKGDTIQVHYRGTLQSTGAQFDASYDRGTPLSFTVGNGQVIKGWDQGLLGMCIGEKRKLTVPPEYGYGQRSIGPIPAGSTLIFETELVGISGVPKPETIVPMTSVSPSSSTPSEATESTAEPETEEDAADETAPATETAKAAEATEAPETTDATETAETTKTSEATEEATAEVAEEATSEASEEATSEATKATSKEDTGSEKATESVVSAETAEATATATAKGEEAPEHNEL